MDDKTYERAKTLVDSPLEVVALTLYVDVLKTGMTRRRCQEKYSPCVDTNFSTVVDRMDAGQAVDRAYTLGKFIYTTAKKQLEGENNEKR